MSQKIDNFCNELRTKLNDADKRLKDLRASAKNKTQQAKNDAKERLERLDNQAKEQQARVDASKAKVKAWAQEKKTITSEKIAEWKAKSERAEELGRFRRKLRRRSSGRCIGRSG